MGKKMSLAEKIARLKTLKLFEEEKKHVRESGRL